MTKSKRNQRNRELTTRACHPDAAGIDIGAEELMEAVPADRAEDPVRAFSGFTGDLHALRDWLLECRVRTVAIESTGNYWVAIYQILEDAGLEVFLVQARHVKGVPGRKSDVCDAAWLKATPLCGAAAQVVPALEGDRAAALPDAPPPQPHRKRLERAAAHAEDAHGDEPASPPRPQRPGRQERAGDPRSHPRRAARPPPPGGALRLPLQDPARPGGGGDGRRLYREECLFVLRQCYARWQAGRVALGELDAEITRSLETIGGVTEEPLPPAPSSQRRARKNTPAAPLVEESFPIYGVDLGAAPGVSAITMGVLISELGTGAQILEAFPSAARFCSWVPRQPDQRRMRAQGRGRYCHGPQAGPHPLRDDRHADALPGRRSPQTARQSEGQPSQEHEKTGRRARFRTNSASGGSVLSY